jgi:hypothetical protein
MANILGTPARPFTSSPNPSLILQRTAVFLQKGKPVPAYASNREGSVLELFQG